MSYLDVYRRQIEYLENLEETEEARLARASDDVSDALFVESEARERLADIRQALEFTREEYQRELGEEE